MNDIFPRGPSLVSRFIIVMVISVIGILIDTKVEQVRTVRAYLTSIVSPIQYVADMPGEMLNWSALRFSSRQQMLEDNQQLTTQLTMLNGELQQLQALKQENETLRNLLKAPLKVDTQKMVAELMAIDNNPYSHQIVLNKGALDSVYDGQAVLDAYGIIGQVLEVGTTNSRVLLITDTAHAIPVRINRTDLMSIAVGTGDYNEIKLQHVPHSADLQVGDLITSSGLGGVYPEGYPVGAISAIISDESKPFKEVRVTPAANMRRLKFLLLLWPDADAPSEAVSGDEIEQTAEVMNAR